MERAAPNESEPPASASRIPRPARRVFGMLALLLLLAVLARWVPIDDYVAALRAFGERQGALWPLIFCASWVVLALLMVPGAPLTMLAGALFGIGFGTLLVSISATVVACVAFVLARHLAARELEALVVRSPRARALLVAVRRSGWRVVLLLRLSPFVPFSLSNYLYGLTGVGLGPYLLATWIGTLPGALLYVWLGHLGAMSAGASGAHSAWEWLVLGIGLVATAAASAHLALLARRALHARGRDAQG